MQLLLLRPILEWQYSKVIFCSTLSSWQLHLHLLNGVTTEPSPTNTTCIISLLGPWSIICVSHDTYGYMLKAYIYSCMVVPIYYHVYDLYYICLYMQLLRVEIIFQPVTIFVCLACHRLFLDAFLNSCWDAKFNFVPCFSGTSWAMQ